MEKAHDFVISELLLENILPQINNLKKKHAWIDNDESRVYFELVSNASDLFPGILLVLESLHKGTYLYYNIL